MMCVQNFYLINSVFGSAEIRMLNFSAFYTLGVFVTKFVFEIKWSYALILVQIIISFSMFKIKANKSKTREPYLNHTTEWFFS